MSKKLLRLMLTAIFCLVVVLVGFLIWFVDDRKENELIEIDASTNSVVIVDNESEGEPEADIDEYVCTAEKFGVRESDFKALLKSYEDPYIIHVRTGLDGYLDGSDEGLGSLAKEGLMLEDRMDGLDNFDKEYYESKFIIYSVDNDALIGGKNITILFKDKPDQLFTAWVYDLPGGDYELRGFWSEGYTPEEMLEVNEMLGCIVDDERFEL